MDLEQTLAGAGRLSRCLERGWNLNRAGLAFCWVSAVSTAVVAFQ